jgi:hypothetical protein
MNLNELIGKEVSVAKDILTNLNILMVTKDNNSGSGDYDTELVVRVRKLEDNRVELITSKFKLKL